MRLFGALPVAEPAHAELVRMLAILRATDWPVRWSRDDGLHLTLKFFGEVAVDRLPGVEAALREAAVGTGVLVLQLTGLGTFPGGGRVRVLWAGVEGPSALELLQDRVERRAAAAGFPIDGRPFRPHVTLGRVREGERLPPRALESLGAGLEPVSFSADRLVLYESLLGTGGARHQPRLTLALDSSWAV